jgi:hypothetical protein
MESFSSEFYIGLSITGKDKSHFVLVEVRLLIHDYITRRQFALIQNSLLCFSLRVYDLYTGKKKNREGICTVSCGSHNKCN